MHTRQPDTFTDNIDAVTCTHCLYLLRDRAAGVGTKDGDDECGCDSTAGICCHDSDHCYCVEEGHTE